MIDHVKLFVADLERSAAFYDRALEPLGYRRLVDLDEAAAFGRDRPYFWIAPRGDREPTVTHVALLAEDRATVEAFHRAALAAGAADNGGPRLRPYYHPFYFGAFVLDADGNNIEAVCHRRDG